MELKDGIRNESHPLAKKRVAPRNARVDLNAWEASRRIDSTKGLESLFSLC